MKDEEELWQSEVLVSDSIGRLIEFWGFKRNMGRLWSILYLSDKPLSAPEIQERLQLSSGAVSMTLNELTRWGVVKKVWIQGERRDHYTAEGNFWKMISRVFNERERVEVLDAIDIMEDAIEFLRDKAKEPEERAKGAVPTGTHRRASGARASRQAVARRLGQGRQSRW